METSHPQTQQSLPNPHSRILITSFHLLIPAGHAAPPVHACPARAAPGERGSRSEEPLAEIGSQRLHPRHVQPRREWLARP